MLHPLESLIADVSAERVLLARLRGGQVQSHTGEPVRRWEQWHNALARVVEHFNVAGCPALVIYRPGVGTASSPGSSAIAGVSTGTAAGSHRGHSGAEGAGPCHARADRESRRGKAGRSRRGRKQSRTRHADSRLTHAGGQHLDAASTVRVIVSDFPLTTGPIAAIDAAVRQLIATDHPRRPGEPDRANAGAVIWTDPADATNARRHALAFADDAARVRLVADGVRRAGLRAQSIIPAEALDLALTARAALHLSDEGYGRPVTALWLGESDSALATAAECRLCRACWLQGSTADLVAALARAFPQIDGAAAAASAEPTPARLAWARRILQQHNVDDSAPSGCAMTHTRAPADAQSADALSDPSTNADGASCGDAPALSAAQVAAAIHPALQQLGAHIKAALQSQSGTHDRAAVRLIGPGALMPGLDRALASICGVPITASPVEGVLLNLPGGGAPAVQVAWEAAPLLQPGLATAEMDDRRTVNRVRWALGVGGAAALLMVAAQGVWVRGELARARQAALAGLVPATQTSTARWLTAIDAESRLAEAHSRIEDRVRAVAPWGVLLEELAAITPEFVRLERVEFRTRPDGQALARLVCVCVEASTPPGARRDPETVADSYVRTLAQHPLVASATRLPGASSGPAGQARGATRFELELAVRTARPSWAADLAARLSPPVGPTQPSLSTAATSHPEGPQ